MEIKNIDTVTHTWNGKTLESNESYLVQTVEKNYWLENEDFKIAIENDKATINGLSKKNSLIYLTGEIVPQNLNEYKELKNSKIDNKTQELIYNNGFDFDSKNFSMSSEAQANWIGLKSMESLLTFPVEITTTSDEAYDLTQANLNSFCGTALATKQSHLDSGRALKVQVNAATTEAEVDAVVDNR